MRIEINRDIELEKRTGGVVSVDGKFFGYSCEDDVREVPGMDVSVWKKEGITAIPRGTYEIVLEDSPKYGPGCPTVKDVPGFKYIRIHSGNTEADTKGCILIGYKRNEDGTIYESRPAIAKLKSIIQVEISVGHQVWLNIG